MFAVHFALTEQSATVLQLEVQAGPVHKYGSHFAPNTQDPVELHVPGRLLSHVVWPGEQTPWQVPLTHVWLKLVQELLVTHDPLAPQLCASFPEHCFCPGAHEPWQYPETQVWLVHPTAVPQVPEVVHIWTPLPEHCREPGTHTPVHAPLTHAKGQRLAVPHAPVASHV